MLRVARDKWLRRLYDEGEYLFEGLLGEISLRPCLRVQRLTPKTVIYPNLWAHTEQTEIRLWYTGPEP